MSLFGKDYDQVQVGGDFRSLPGGGYVCRILKAQKGETSTGLPRIEVIVDISDGEFKGYFQGLYRDRLATDPNAKYPYNGVLRITTTDENGNTKKNFKSFVTSVEKSNECELPKNSDDAFLKSLKDKTVGVLYQREEYMGNDGKKHWSTKPKWFRDVATIESENFEIPKDVFLDTYDVSGFAGTTIEADSFNAAMDDIPFGG